MKLLLLTELKNGLPTEFKNRRGQTDYAFEPRKLPCNWQMPESFWPLVVEASREVASLSGRTAAIHPLLLTRHFQRREALRSTKLEGTNVAARQLFLFEFDHNTAPSTSEQWDSKEVHNLDLALQRGCRIAREDTPLTVELITDLHRTLMAGLRNESKSRPGQLRDDYAHVGQYTAPPPSRVPELLQNLADYIADPRDAFDPLVRAFIVHYQFEAIHPFNDGNGRLGRVLLEMNAARWLKMKRPWFFLSDYFDGNSDEYRRRLLEVSTHSAWGDWISFCLQGAIQTAKDSASRVSRFVSLRKEYLGTFSGNGPKGAWRARRVIDWLFQSPVVTAPQLAKGCEIAFETAQSEIRKLVEIGILTELDARKPKTYVAKEIIRVTYD